MEKRRSSGGGCYFSKSPPEKHSFENLSQARLFVLFCFSTMSYQNPQCVHWSFFSNRSGVLPKRKGSQNKQKNDGPVNSVHGWPLPSRHPKKVIKDEKFSVAPTKTPQSVDSVRLNLGLVSKWPSTRCDAFHFFFFSCVTRLREW